MLPEIGATELLVIAAVALIVVGPKDLPVLMRRIGQFMARMRAMAAEFRSSFDEMARQSELDELRREVEAMRQGRLMEEAAASAGQAELQSVFSDIDQGLRAPPEAQIYVEAQDEEVPGAAPPPPTPRARKPRAPKAEAPKAEAAPPKPRARRPAAKPVPAKAAPKAAPGAAKSAAPKPAAKTAKTPAKPRTKKTQVDA